MRRGCCVLLISTLLGLLQSHVLQADSQDYGDPDEIAEESLLDDYYEDDLGKRFIILKILILKHLIEDMEDFLY